MADQSTWKGTRVRRSDGVLGAVISDYIGFAHRSLHIIYEDGADGHVQLNADGPDSGDRGVEWDTGGGWYPLGDHNKESSHG